MGWRLRNRLNRVVPGLPNRTGSVMFSTDHNAFDYKMIEKEAKLIVDTHGKVDKIR